MIPYSITDGGLVFLVKGRPYPITLDHPQFARVKEVLTSGSDDVEVLLDLVDFRRALARVGGDRLTLTQTGIALDGEPLSDTWIRAIRADPAAATVLLVDVGQQIQVVGDEDAPDGIYTVAAVDDADPQRRLYVEDDSYFGYVLNTSVHAIANSG